MKLNAINLAECQQSDNAKGIPKECFGLRATSAVRRDISITGGVSRRTVGLPHKFAASHGSAAFVIREFGTLVTAGQGNLPDWQRFGALEKNFSALTRHFLTKLDGFG